jgi:formylglycine-generating enzyme
LVSSDSTNKRVIVIKMDIKPENFTQKVLDTAFDMIFVEGGTFMMGAAEDDLDAADWTGEKGKHSVQLSSFFMGKYTVTQALFKSVVNGLNPSKIKGENRPVEMVSWFDAADFCNKLNKLLGFEPCYFADAAFSQVFIETGEDYRLKTVSNIFIRLQTMGYRLPTEAEWEYAARGGKHWQDDFRYAGSNKLKEVGWFNNNSHREAKPFGLKLPNQLQIHDLSGNVCEWCQDWMHENYYKECIAKGTTINPIGSEWGFNRVNRGCSWNNLPQGCRVDSRHSWRPERRSDYIGFRLCLSCPQ